MNAYTELELHLDAMPLSRSHIKRIKEAGGRYSHARSIYASKRFVTLPAVERALINELVIVHPGLKLTTMIARGNGTDGLPSWIVVQQIDSRRIMEAPIDQFERKYRSALKQARERGIVR
jgi:hypothetical protein